MPGVIERLRGVGLRSMISRIPHSRFQAHMTRAPFVVLCRAFFGRFFASESATSDEALRQAIVGVLAFILTPCLLILINVFPQFQLLVIRVGRVHPPPGVVVRATAVRNINAEDMLEWAVAILVAYSMVSIGLVAVWVWDALGFDRRDGMVLGPLPVRWTTIAAAKVTALAALLLGASTTVNLLNATVFALETSDRFGAGALVRHFVACMIVTTAAAALVFATAVTVRAGVALVGGQRLAAVTGAALQFAFVVAALVFFVATFAPPAQAGVIALPTLTLGPPTAWFVAWFERIRGSERGAWDEFSVMAARAPAAVAIAGVAAIAASVASVRRQLQAALTPAATPGPLGRARVSRAIARVLIGAAPTGKALVDFILTTIARNRAQQGPIAVNAAIGAAAIVMVLARERRDAIWILLAVPLVLACWLGVGLRASFFVPSDLPASWAFRVNAARAPCVYWASVRAAAIGFLLPFSIAADALLIPAIGVGAAAAYGLVVVAVTVLVAEGVAATIDFIPFTCAYRPGHARLKTRWPVYLLLLVAIGFAPAAAARRALDNPVALASLAAKIAAVALIVDRVARVRASRWSIDDIDERLEESSTVGVLDIGFTTPGASRI